MELSVFCIVVIVGVAWVPGDAQGGIVFEPKHPETKHPEPWHPKLWHPKLWHPKLWHPKLWHPKPWNLEPWETEPWETKLWHPKPWNPEPWETEPWETKLWHPKLWHPKPWNPEPWETESKQKPNQNEIYTAPREEEIDTRQRQGCRRKLTVGDRGRTITSPRYPRNYPNRLRCAWKIKARNRQATLNVQCNDFNVVPSPSCSQDRFMIFENKVLKEQFCGTGPKSYRSTTNKIKISFKTNRQDTSRGFSCQVLATNTTRSIKSSACDCGVANPNRIVGGVEVTPPHKFPWQVGLKFSGGTNYDCGGSIICRKYVLTAAHCFYDQFGNLIPTDGLVVGVGDHNMDSSVDDVSGVTREVIVEQVIIHQSYSFSTNDNDIALLKLSEDLDLSPKEIGAVCLPADDSKTYEGVMATASGWGTLSSGGQQPDVLNEVTLPILEPSCWGIPVTENMVCAGLVDGGKDTCQGDSGGPLTVQEDSKYVQVGITSWGYGCANPFSPGVYARVSRFLPWIKSKTADGDCCF